MNLKNEITLKLAEALGYQTDEKSLKKYQKSWWVNPRNKPHGGLKLSDNGFLLMEEAKIKKHKIRLEEDIENTAKTVIKLDQFIDCPWYMDQKHIYVYSEKMAVQLVLFSGNLNRFLTAKLKFKNEY